MQEGTSQNQHHPLVVEKGDIGMPRHEPPNEMVMRVDHRDTGEDEEHP